MNDEPLSDVNGKNNINSNYEVTKKNEKAFKNKAEEDSLKECPQCAESVKEKAKICRFCTHEFETEELSPIDKKEEELLKECPQCSEYIKKEVIKCKYCGENLKNTTSDSENNHLTPDFIFDGLIDAFEENLELQLDIGASWIVTEVEIGNFSLQVVQSKSMEGLEHLKSETFPGITICLPLIYQSVEFYRFNDFDECNLFSQVEHEDFVEFYIHLGNDTHQAGILVSKIFLSCLGASKNDTVTCINDDFGQHSETTSKIETESVQKDSFIMRSAEEPKKTKKLQKKKKPKLKIFIWLMLGVIIFLYLSGSL